MKKCLSGLLVMVLSTCLIGCGASPREAGRAFARGVVASADSGDPAVAQSGMAEVQAKTKGMSAKDAAEFIQGYQEVVTPWIQNKLGR